jgi:flavin reductase (DIM6/NTAB) family NADH-FMN oxidoreductase RutF
MGSFATGVTVIAVRRQDGSVKAMTASAFMSGSLEPPLCVVAIGKGAQMHRHMSHAQRFSVNVLARGQESLSNHFAGRKVEGLKIHFDWLDDVPVLPGTIARIVAEKSDAPDCGDHTLFIGRVLDIDFSPGAPLVYFASHYGSFVPSAAEAGEVGPFW